MAEKLKSRKFWVTFGALALMLFAQQLGIDLGWEQIAGIVSTVTGYNIGQGYVDGQKAKTDVGLARFLAVDKSHEPKPGAPAPDADG